MRPYFNSNDEHWVPSPSPSRERLIFDGKRSAMFRQIIFYPAFAPTHVIRVYDRPFLVKKRPRSSLGFIITPNVPLLKNESNPSRVRKWCLQFRLLISNSTSRSSYFHTIEFPLAPSIFPSRLGNSNFHPPLHGGESTLNLQIKHQGLSCKLSSFGFVGVSWDSLPSRCPAVFVSDGVTIPQKRHKNFYKQGWYCFELRLQLHPPVNG